ncbi:MAG: nucleotidyltransferase [Rhodothermaceae bacterium]|nr:nucleotidyltransferase [Rhodothermaceae bacterium]MYJ56275.1 nucleotidyltransferase [Rhodothermaceae bacterium]
MPFVQGSYRNRVTVRRDSDVNVGVMCHDAFLPQYPRGMTHADFGNTDSQYSFSQFKDELEKALVLHFGRTSVARGNKSLTVREHTNRVEADVTPFFEFRDYENKTPYVQYVAGVALFTDGGKRIENYPEQLLPYWPSIPLHYENGIAKNRETLRRFKGVVRILKRLRNTIAESGNNMVQSVPGYLIECLTWNVPNQEFLRDSLCARVQAVLAYVWSNTREDSLCNSWCEVDNTKYLFHWTQPWTREAAHAFADAALRYLGMQTR